MTQSRRFRARNKVLMTYAGAVLLTISAAACSSGSGTSASGDAAGLPSEVKILSITDLSGISAELGTEQYDGAALAVDQANSSKMLGKTKIVLSKEDTTGAPQTAATLMRQAASDQSISAVLGPLSGSEAQAMAPIAESSKTPIAFTQSGGDGVVIGPYTFRVTAAQSSFFPVAQKYMQSKDVKSVSVIYDSTNPTLTALGTQAIQKDASAYGYAVKSTTAVSVTTTDFSAPVASALKPNPDVVAVFVQAAANATAVSQLRQAGFKGTILAQLGAGGGTLTPDGAAADNVVWATDFSAATATSGIPAAFVKAYTAKYGSQPSNFAAEGYDAAELVLRGIKAAGSANRTAVEKGMNTVAAQGFEGAEGSLKFADRNLEVGGFMVEWNGKTEVTAP
jgi:branched-chain amino acid transport system substrate-binding protein